MEKKVKCWEFFQCYEELCPAYKSKNLNCWLFSGTHCRGELQGKFLEKMEMCLECNVFTANMNVNVMNDTIEVVNKQFKEYRNKVEDRDRELQDISMDLALGLSESFEMLQNLSLGDPTARIEITTKNELLAKLQSELNRMVENIQKMVDQHHELAMGLCEHYDTLVKIASGDRNARASETSENELIAKLGVLINKETSTLTEFIEDMEATSMELALGLSENLEVLRKVAEGNLTVRAPEESEDELLAKLGTVVNQTIINLKKSWDELQESKEKLEQELVERKRAEEEAHRRAAQAALIYEVGQRVSRELNLETLLFEIGTTVQEGFNYYCVMLLLIDERTNRLTLRSIAGGHAGIFPKDLSIPVGPGFLGQVAATGNTQVISDVTQDPRYKQRAGEVIKSELAVPIKRADKVIGVLYIQSDEYDAFDEMDVVAMENLSAQIATAIENAQLYKQAQREIAERVRAEKALTLEKAYLEQLFENAPEAIVMIDNEGGVLRVNSEFNELFGYTRHEVFGRCVDELIVPEDLQDEAVSITKQVIKGEKSTFETIRRRKDGTSVNVSIIGSPIIVEDQQVAAYGIYRDITKRVREEERRAQLLKELEIVNRELKDFAYIVSHDLKAPLRAISSLANWMLTDYEEKFDEAGKELLYLLMGRVKRMNDLIDSILQYSRVGRIREEKQDVNMSQLVTEVIDMIDPPQNIKIELENELPLISCEKTRMEQVFQNLVGNAVKYMDKPEGEIRISCAPEKDYWKFSIADNGPGIEDKYFDKIFQIFQTLVPRDESESTGIGLTLVKRIVETYGGKIWVESEVGAGSTFFFTVPQ